MYHSETTHSLPAMPLLSLYLQIRTVTAVCTKKTRNGARKRHTLEICDCESLQGRTSCRERQAQAHSCRQWDWRQPSRLDWLTKDSCCKVTSDLQETLRRSVASHCAQSTLLQPLHFDSKTVSALYIQCMHMYHAKTSPNQQQQLPIQDNLI